ncbi:AfsR/SARP family transcriptional regulator [Goodfellowiella coeruleoviolacea]|uniref:DNA-binding transcriptional activator of the SARP family n=1 Tax=Goodfellowiella coeruleoviolacea TaxID=334858 RepID=A0AAE3G9F1_9PSEU|nr:AfsR/SARP family transcriptional regulator [Goodfellowiella coeruleoviolacea]MCP2164102.1 DNA-binding transcriptional activator of the SARP family [Goodfellowiella coeruleoviolacea]
MIRFSVLGSLELQTPQGAYVPRGPKVRKVFALLLLRANQIVDVDTLTDELWDENPPRTVITTVRTHVYHLRKMLDRESRVSTVAQLLTTQPTGYLLRTAPDQLDATVFARLVDQARVLLAQEHVTEASHLLRKALGLWRGPALANVAAGRVLGRHVLHLNELRTRALELRIETDMLLGRHRELVAELRGLLAAHPLNEWFHAHLIRALHRSGRRGEALAAFQDLRALLDRELGLEPSPELHRLQHEILTGTPAEVRPAHQVLAGLPVDARAVS